MNEIHVSQVICLSYIIGRNVDGSIIVRLFKKIFRMYNKIRNNYNFIPIKKKGIDDRSASI